MPCAVMATPSEAQPFSYEYLVSRAASEVMTRADIPGFSKASIDQNIDISPSEWSKLRFKIEKAPWTSAKFNSPLILDYPARFFPSTSKVYWVDKGKAQEIIFSDDLFDEGQDAPMRKRSHLDGFSGLRFLRSQNNNQSLNDSWLLFLGDKSFRARPLNGTYGTLAHALGIQTKNLDSQMDFPGFSEFYIERLEDKGVEERIDAYLDFPDITAAYRFKNQISETEIIQNIEATVFVRRELKSIALMPLATSFSFSETDKSRGSDIHPEWHDADGLLIQEDQHHWTWRPLIRSREKLSSGFKMGGLKGFGLLQRDRDPEHYLDDSKPETRTNVWIEPLESPGNGELVLEEESSLGAIENVNVAWRPFVSMRYGDVVHLSYRIHWGLANVHAPDLAYCLSTRIGRIPLPKRGRGSNGYRARIEYEGPDRLLTTLNHVVMNISASNGMILGRRIIPTRQAGHFFVEFDFRPESSGLTDLDIQLLVDGEPISEAWRYSFIPRQ